MADVRRRQPRATPRWPQIAAVLHLRLNDAAAELGVCASTLKAHCRRNGLPRWPGKKIRYVMAKMEQLSVEVVIREQAPPGVRRRRLATIIAETTKIVEEFIRISEEICSAGPREPDSGGSESDEAN
ncbi:hypothetical protein ACP4OV_027008 [Aristida adscensionis]